MRDQREKFENEGAETNITPASCSLSSTVTKDERVKSRWPMRVAVGIATVGRPRILTATLDRLCRQTRPADAIIVCSPSIDDVRGTLDAHPQVTYLDGPRGSSHQRNVILSYLKDFDVVIFYDDDFIACPKYIANVEKIMAAHPDVVVATGALLEDGILGPGLSIEHADLLIERSEKLDFQACRVENVFNGYGCNMAVRLAPVHQNSLAFDERLPLYAWLEDIDFSRQLSRFGRIVKSGAIRGVHLGVKSGRQSGERLGYSQIANPLFLIQKGTCTWSRGLFLMSRNFAANLIRSRRPEPWVDRVGRLKGNIRAIQDLFLGRLRPDRVLSF